MEYLVQGSVGLMSQIESALQLPSMESLRLAAEA